MTNDSPPVPARIDATEVGGWRRHVGDRATLWISGHLFNDSIRGLLRYLDDLTPEQVPERLSTWLRDLDGLFGLIADTPAGTLAATDRVRSAPILLAHTGRGPVLGFSGPRLAAMLNDGVPVINHVGALAVGMAGYAQAEDTIYEGLEQLRAGEFVFISRGGELRRDRYYRYAPWRVTQGDDRGLAGELGDVTVGLFEKLVRSLDGRPVAVPLSAGLDSRLVVSMLHELRYPDVRCFSYGLPGNFEARAARAISARLGYPWTFVPYTQSRQRECFHSDLYRAFSAYGDWSGTFPFFQDVLAIHELKSSGWLPDDAVIVNGNSGDFISGGHVPPGLVQPSGGSPQARRQRIFDFLAHKHFSLWQSLKTQQNLALMQERVEREWALAGIDVDPDDESLDYTLYEFIEWQERQCKYVISGQRNYEFFGHDWRLPLWDRDYLEFWEKVPSRHKLGQRLYRDMLSTRDWGGVWRDFPVREYLSPAWMRPLRTLLKVPFAVLGKERWQEFELRYLAYWRQIGCNFALVPYRRVAMDRRGFRAGGHSWHAEAYLNAKGLGIDGYPLPTAHP